MLTTLLALAMGAAPTATLPPYAHSIRCAGLAEAALGRPPFDKAERKLFDAAMFWGMAASERARADGISAVQFSRDQEVAKEHAARDLQTGPSAMAELDRCMAGVPLTDARG